DEVVAPAANAMNPLSQVYDLEPAREGPDQIASQGRRPVAHAGRELTGRLLVAVTTADGGDAVELDQLEQRVAALFGQDLAHERSEGMHVVAQRLVLRGEMYVASAHGEPESLPF